MIPSQGRRLDSWKEIAEYLGRDVRTVQRWEGEKGLPIHRVPGGKRQAVFGYQDEIDGWLISHSENYGTESAVVAVDVIEPAAEAPSASRPPAVPWWILGGTAALALAAAAGFWLRSPEAVPQVTDYVQISEDIQVGPGLAADQSRLYFRGKDGDFREVSTGAGRAVSIPLPIHDMELGDLCAARSELMLTSQGYSEDRPLWLFPLPGGPAHRLGNVVGGPASCSPDGKTIVYAQGHSLYLTDHEGAHSRLLAALAGRPIVPRWSPDGSVVRFSVEDSQSKRLVLWEAAAKAGKAHPLFPGWKGCSGDEYRGSWTRDGRYYVFDCAEEDGSKLWARREGSGFLRAGNRWPVRLTYSPISLYNPVFSADGSKIFALGGTHRAEVVQYDAGLGELAPFGPGVAGDMLDFSRQGDLLTYVGYPYQELWRCRSDGTERLRLAGGRVIYPRWSPDGRSIAYCSLKGKQWKLHVIAATGGAPQELAAGDGHQSHPSWSPDGETLAFAGAPWEEAFTPASTAVHLFHLKTRELETLPGSQGLWSPRWSPDGRYLAAITIDSRRVVTWDFTTRKWVDTAGLDVDYTVWSHDGRYLYMSTVPSADGSMGIHRVAVRDGKLERVLTLRGVRLTGTLGHWFGLAPDDSPLFLQDRSISAVYALDWRAP